jgi:hypothetical protein
MADKTPDKPDMDAMKKHIDAWNAEERAMPKGLVSIEYEGGPYHGQTEDFKGGFRPNSPGALTAMQFVTSGGFPIGYEFAKRAPEYEEAFGRAIAIQRLQGPTATLKLTFPKGTKNPLHLYVYRVTDRHILGDNVIVYAAHVKTIPHKRPDKPAPDE